MIEIVESIIGFVLRWLHSGAVWFLILCIFAKVEAIRNAESYDIGVQAHSAYIEYMAWNKAYGLALEDGLQSAAIIHKIGESKDKLNGLIISYNQKRAFWQSDLRFIENKLGGWYGY